MNGKIARLRQEHGISQSDLAYAIDMTRVTVANVETGNTKPSLKFIKNTLRFFQQYDPDIKFQDLFDYETNKTG